MYKEGLSGYREEKILIQLDTEPQHFDFVPEKYIINRFDIFTQIFITPLNLLLSQKFYAVCNRERNKGRDFFDIVFLLSLVDRPDYNYLELKMGVSNEKQLKEKMIEKCSRLNMKEMSKDVQPFLFNPKDAQKVLLFSELINQAKLS